MIQKVWNEHRQRDVWLVNMHLDGRGSPRIRRMFDDEADARALESEIIRARQAAPYDIGPKGHALRDAFKIKRDLLESKKERQISRRVESALIGLTGDIRLTDLTTEHLIAYRRQREGDGVSPATVKRELTNIGAALHEAKRVWPDLAQWNAPRLPYPKNADRRRERLIMPDEYRAILAWLLAARRPGEHQNYHRGRLRVGLTFYFALLTGCRHGEIDKLKWGDIEESAGRIRIVQTKTGATKYLPLTPTLRWVIDERRKDREPECGFVFTGGGNTSPFYYRALRDACEANNIPYGREVENGLITHDTRHTLVTMLLQSGMDMRTVGSISGHADQTLILHYSHPTERSRQEAAALIESAFGRTSTEENPTPEKVNG